MPKHKYSTVLAEIPLLSGPSLLIHADADVERDTLLQWPQNALLDFGEEPVQLLEGASYEYQLPPGYSFDASQNSIVRPSKLSGGSNKGRLLPGLYVGRLTLRILHPNQLIEEIAVEVRSVKAEYRSEYRKMLEEITDSCTALLMIHSSQVTQRFTVDYQSETNTIYQQFAFVKSVVDSDEFRNAIQRIIYMPVTAWSHRVKEVDIRRSKRITSSQLRQFASRQDRTVIPENHQLRSRLAIDSIPTYLTVEEKIDSVDTPENRFIKHVLQEFQRFCGMVCRQVEGHAGLSTNRPYIYYEARNLEERLGGYLSHQMFLAVSRPESLPLNSPVLQRKEGYREVLRAWLMFDLAAKLTWNALDDDQYQVGKRDVATLYEYWLFFKLLNLMQEVFQIAPKESEQLIQRTSDGLGLQLRAGRHIAIEGQHSHNGRLLRMQFSYNRTFSKADYPQGGSWTKPMRPDYTLSLWPADFSQSDAEAQELIVHVHFDAKYKVEGLKYLLADEEENLASQEQFLNNEKADQKEGTYKRADLLKMHAYKDAIRRTAGAYVLYPGSKEYQRQGFHEIVPGLGAFPISPSNNGQGLTALGNFIRGVVEHFTDRASQREAFSYHAYEVHGANKKNKTLRQRVPEYTVNRDAEKIRPAPPNKVTVLIGFYNEDQLAWIQEKRLYNIRIDKTNGLAKYGPNEIGAKYLLLHSLGKLESNELWEIVGNGPQLMSKEELLDNDYPRKPSRDFYLVYQLKPVDRRQFSGKAWDIRMLPGYTLGRGSARPFAVTLSEFMEAVIIEDSQQ